MNLLLVFSFVFSLASVVAVVAGLELIVLHTNDLHSRFDQITARGSACRSKEDVDEKCFGGVARIKALVDDIKHDNPNRVLFLNGGDFFQGTVWYSLFKYGIVANLTSKMGYTATSPGNHEFDDGVPDLIQFLIATKDAFPTVACNLDLSKEPELRRRMKNSIVVTVENNIKVGIIGYVTPETKDLASTGQVVFLDEVESIRKEVALLKSQGVKILIAVGHSGYNKDKEIAEQVDGLDIVVGGHTNTFLWNSAGGSGLRHQQQHHHKLEEPAGSYPTVVLQPGTGRSVLVVQTSGYGKYLGYLKVRMDEQGELVHFSGNPILLDHHKRKDAELDRLVKDYGERVKAKMEVEVGQSTVFIDGGRPKCRLEECSFGNLATDAMMEEMETDVAIINSGAIKGSFDNGTITMEDVVNAMPWSNSVDVITIPGKALKSVLEHSVSEYDPDHEDPGGRFLQLSGLVVTYDVRRPAGYRLLSAYVGLPGSDTEPVGDEQHYKVAVLSFMVKGGDGYQMIPDNLIEHKNTGFLDNDLLVAYLRRKSPIGLPKPGRIVLVSGGGSTSKASSSFSFSSKSMAAAFPSLIFSSLALFLDYLF